MLNADPLWIDRVSDHGDTLKVIHTFPPNWSMIVRAFPQVQGRRGLFFCWDTAIYSPTSGVNPSAAIRAHEAVHSRRQNGDPYGWWEEYLKSKTFRLAEELPAHQAEYLVAVEGANRHYRKAHLALIAERLSSRLYGSMITKQEAKRLVQGSVGLPNEI